MAKKTGPKTIGYARVSTADQNLDGQVKALEKFGCDRVFVEKASGANMSRKVLSRALLAVRKGDTFVVWKLDRLARSLKGLIEVVELFQKKGIRFVSLTDNIDADTASGRLLLHMIGAIAEFERGIISERTKIGMAARRNAGVSFGPKHSISGNPKRVRAFLKLRDSGKLLQMSAREVIEAMNKADPKAEPITSPQTYRNWKYKGFRGLPEPEDDPLELDNEK